jgi:flavin-dependent dehydrogenase
MDETWDIFIAGAGPAGSATALSLASAAPELRVCLADAGDDNPFHVGESVPPLIHRFLDHLGVWQTFLAEGHRPSFRTMSAWGSPELMSNEFFLSAQNTGWVLDRARFDRWLAAQAAGRGARPLPAKVRTLTHNGEGWQIDCGKFGIHRARCVVDATGRAALLSRQAGLIPVHHDRLVASVGFFPDTGDTEQPGADAAVVETFQHGWWYTAATRTGQRVVALMTDSDLVRRLGAARLETWLEHVASTHFVRPLLSADQPLVPLRVWPASSCCLEGSFPIGLLPVGDAISCFDPLSSQGILKALRSGIFASYAIADWLLHSDDGQGCARYATLIRQEFESYRTTQHEYYRQEQRWPEAPFWQRRHRHTGSRQTSSRSS